MTSQQNTKIERRAVIDIGTVTTRLMIADCIINTGTGQAQDVQVLFKTAIITELGEDLFKTGKLKKEAIARVAYACDQYIHKMQEFGLDIVKNTKDKPFAVAMATSAARDASNSDELKDELDKRNIFLSIVSGEKEASLSFAGAVSGVCGDNILVNDIGGGSTELIFGASHAAALPQIYASHSFNVGCRRVKDLFLHTDPPTKDELNAAHNWVYQQIKPFFDVEIKSASLSPNSTQINKMIGVAGTATSLVSMHDKMAVYDSAKVHGRTMRIQDVEEALGNLASLTLEQRQNVVGLEPKRADVIVAGMLILQVLMQLADIDELIVSESDNLVGLMMNWSN